MTHASLRLVCVIRRTGNRVAFYPTWLSLNFGCFLVVTCINDLSDDVGALVNKLLVSDYIMNDEKVMNNVYVCVLSHLPT